MEIISGFFLWLLVDVMGIKTIRKERSVARKIWMTFTFITIGFISVVLYFLFFS